jgi:hypothetical protein
VPEGVFTETGHFVHIPDIWRHRAAEIWQEKVFDLLLDACKIDLEVAANMRGWKHSGFNVDNSVRIEAGDHAGMQRLVEYVSRCPFSLARMVTLNADGRIVYRASKGKCFPFPHTGDPVLPERCTPPIQTLMEGIPRNFEVFDPLDFLAEVTQHIPNKGEHQIRYYGFYSNKRRGMRRDKSASAVTGQPEPDNAFRRKCRMTWAALIKCVYEVDPLKCPHYARDTIIKVAQPLIPYVGERSDNCGGEMRIISFIEEDEVIRKILKHCGLWKEQAPRPPPEEKPPPEVEETKLDYEFFEKTCA